MRRILLTAMLGVWLLWACAAPAQPPAPEVATATAANTVVVYKSPT